MRGRRDDVGVRRGIVVPSEHFAGNQTSEVSHVHHEHRSHLVSDLAHLGKIELTRISAVAGQQNQRLHLDEPAYATHPDRPSQSRVKHCSCSCRAGDRKCCNGSRASSDHRSSSRAPTTFDCAARGVLRSTGRDNLAESVSPKRASTGCCALSAKIAKNAHGIRVCARVQAERSA